MRVEAPAVLSRNCLVARPMSEDALRVWATKWELK
jgi:hypothetical protein